MTLNSSSENESLTSHSGCKCCDRGLILPLIDESSWSDAGRAVLYFIALIYSFFGISIACDVFMCAIERITSKTRTVKVRHPEFGSVEDLGEASEGIFQDGIREVKVWNPTLANLTLMALGSSAPEILLTAIEIIGRDFKAGQLGPSTIVGSAAFNLLIITAICISSIPHPQTRRLSEILVFVVTSAFSILAYVWLLIILKVVSPNVVEVWEALLTLIFFVVLLVVAYAADKKFCYKWLPKKKVGIQDVSQRRPYLNGETKDVKWETPQPAMKGEPEKHGDIAAKESGHPEPTDTVSLPLDQVSSVSRPVTAKTILIRNSSRLETGKISSSSAGWLQIQRMLAKKHPHASAETLARLAAEEIDASHPHSRLYYRIAATKWLSAAHKTETHHHRHEDEEHTTYSPRTLVSLETHAASGISNSNLLAVDPCKLSIIEFAANKYAVSETDSHVKLKVVRRNRTNKRILFKYETLDGSAKRGKDYISQSETLVFNPAETEKIISIHILKDRNKEPDEMFYVKLSLEDFADGRTMIGPNNVAMVTIVDNEKDNKLQLPQSSMAVKENSGTIHIPVTRRGNMKHKVSVEWHTVDGSAVNKKDFFGGSGVIEFDTGEIEKHIDITIIDDKEVEKHESFEIVLRNPSEGTSLSSKKKRCIVTILNDDETTLLLTQSDKLVPKQLEALQPGAQSWHQQFIQAANVNGGDIENATVLDYLIHLITFGWKLLFAFVPPPTVWGGWLTFIIAIVLIGVLVTIVGDLASIFGCLVGLRDPATAMTVLALGTSLPDLFASRFAAVRERSADNAVGNITGSNSVNIFLGLGISWFIAAVYWSRQGGRFYVPAADLTFSVTIYTITAVLCIGLLMVRRNLSIFGRAELGGPRLSKWMCSGFLVFLWLLYVTLSVLQIYGYVPSF